MMNKIKGLVSALPYRNSFSNCGLCFIIKNSKMRGCATGKTAGRFLIQDKDLESEENMMDFYERWMRFHGRFRIDPEEKNKRFKLFAERVKGIHNHNKQPGISFTMKAGVFADSFEWRR
ncbi:Proteinase inhibitor I29 [Macleaya cordata]|uniref:Proteinase inhibitor I29 n=1 Tax=Macleaya cordata TaxID=56857 RepID=A0A200PNT7_MACCD|nr:Proteinase inhibitor I29 [Macleaya cordata]